MHSLVLSQDYGFRSGVLRKEWWTTALEKQHQIFSPKSEKVIIWFASERGMWETDVHQTKVKLTLKIMQVAHTHHTQWWEFDMHCCFKTISSLLPLHGSKSITFQPHPNFPQLQYPRLETQDTTFFNSFSFLLNRLLQQFRGSLVKNTPFEKYEDKLDLTVIAVR